ncbi:dihydropyrimidinase [Microvirga alba]|uniref:D-hydantoinase n=1 Tax=Microvirga alba TaxID=2791025 RepID=A0A931BX72_9HYPH|nr:dihydropyrimidinase [Microvirga alba]MBF9235480.1 dihydropyrimidinase [Microvirga alba]
MSYDLVIRGGVVGTSEGTFAADVGVRGGRIVGIGTDLATGAAELDAKGRFVLPGGVDSHCHIEQMSAAGIMTADDFESATASAAFGGTTTVISFAAQQRGMDLRTVVKDYHLAARRGAMVDYSFHMIVADPTEEALAALPELIGEGHASIKAFMTYDRIRLEDEQILDLLAIAREHDATVCVHAENHGMIAWMSKRLLQDGKTSPRYQPASHPRESETEAFQRLIAMAEFTGHPVTIFHVSTSEGAAVVREARERGVRVTAETCPHYLLLTEEDVDKPGIEGAKWCCSPPLRSKSDQEALWEALRRRDLQLVSSDHAPYAWDETGKLKNGPNATFKQIANGMPGLEARQMLMFDAMISQGRMSIADFVDLTSTAPARHYGLFPRKGAIMIGADADIVLWNPERSHTLTAATLHDRTGYTPYEGRTVRGYPEIVVRRGEIIVADGDLRATKGSGTFLPRGAGFA